MQQIPTNDFSIIPSWNKEFVCLIGLEDVVQFRLESMDKSANSVPNQSGSKGRSRKNPAGAVPATLRKEPYTCAKCNTDVSCSWKRDVNSSMQCHSCFNSKKKDHWPSSEPPDTVIQSVFVNSSMSSSQAFQDYSQLSNQHCDQQVPKGSLSLLHPDLPGYCSSPLSSDCSSSPGFYTDASSQCACSFTADHYFSDGSFFSSSSCSSLCDDSSLSSLPFSSDLVFSFSSSSSSFMTSSESVSPPINSSECILQKVETPLAKDFLKDDKVKQETKKEKAVQWAKKEQRKEGKMATKSVPTNHQLLPKTPSVLLVPSSVLFSINKHQSQTQMVTPNLQNDPTMIEELKDGQGNLQKLTPNVSGGYGSAMTPGSSTRTPGAGKTKSTTHYLPATQLNVSGNKNQQDSRSIPRSFDHVKKESATTNQANHVWSEENPNQKIDNWPLKPNTSLGSHGSCSFRAPPSSLVQPEK